MSAFDTLSELSDKEEEGYKNKPFWKVNLEDDDQIKSWMNLMFDTLRKASAPRFQRYTQNIAAYRGITLRSSQKSRDRYSTDTPRRSVVRNLRISVNNLHDIIEQNVSRETRYRPAVNFLPLTDDHADKMASKVVEKINEAVWNRENIDQVIQEHSRNTKVVAESYILCYFDKTKGPLHPDYVAKIFEANGIKGNPADMSLGQINTIFKHQIKKVPTVNFKDPETGEVIKIERPIRIGEIKYKVLMATNMLFQPKRHYKDVDWGMWFEFIDIDSLRQEYPKQAENIKETDHLKIFDADLLEERNTVNEALVIHFYHRSTIQMDKGAYIKMTPDAILENRENDYAQVTETQGFPWVRRKDVDIPGNLHGVSALEFGRPLQEWINNLSSMLVRQQAMAAHPKWVAPLNSVKTETLGNDSTILWYRGGIPPKLDQPNPGASNTFNLIELFDKKLQQIMGVFGVSRGTPPPGVKSGIALQFLNEQEDERANGQTADHNSGIKDLGMLTIFTAGLHYDPSDKRLEKLLGAANAHMADDFDLAYLSRDWDVKAQTASALPQQKSQRIQSILDLRKEFPGRVNDDEALDMIGFGAADKFISVNTVNIRAAEAENDGLLRTGKSIDPMEYEDQISHYRLHIRQLNEPAMKDDTVPKTHVAALRDHIMAHEMIMEQQIARNPQMLQPIMAEFPFYPLYITPAPMDLPPMGEELNPEQMAAGGMPQGALPEAPAFNPGDVKQEFPQVENQIPVGQPL